jgi:ribonuclease R
MTEANPLPGPAEILSYLEKRAGHPQKPKEIARALNVSGTQYRAFKELLKTLEDEGELYRVKKGRYAPPEKLNLVVGLIRVVKSGHGFVVPDVGGNEVFVAREDMDTALHEDRVVVRIERMRRRLGTGRPGVPGGMEGSVIKILERARTELVGTVGRGRTHVVVVPDDPRITRDIFVPLDQSQDAADRQKVVVEVLSWGTPNSSPVGRISEILGTPGDPGLDILTIIKHHRLPDRFPPEVEHAAEALPGTLSAEDLARREDFRDRLVLTIDPVDAKDFDDALSLRELEGGLFELGVHIADVSHYVKMGDPIDLEAYKRGTSVYLVDRVIPMLPERLSNELCSLKPEVDRPAMSVIMTVDGECRVKDARIADTVIHSRHRLTYEKVQAIFEGDVLLREQYAGIIDLLYQFRSLALKLTARRSQRGSLDFDLPESRVLLDKDGFPMDIQKVVRLESHRLIEEFMVLANETVARHLRRKKIPGIFRVHEPPDPMKIEALLEVITPLGYHLKRSKDGELKPTALQELLKKALGKVEENLINTIVLRSMKRARYDERALGHYGLASLDYLHFTSPIRRYPDLVVHRALRQAAGLDAAPVRDSEEWKLRLRAISVHSSEREQVATDAERDSVEVKKTEFMVRHLGEEFHGTITGVTAFGFFVELHEFHVEGLVHVNTLGDDFYHFREEMFALVGENTKRMFRLGDRVLVQVVGVKKELRQIDFVLLNKEGEARVDPMLRRSSGKPGRGPGTSRRPAPKAGGRRGGSPPARGATGGGRRGKKSKGRRS